MPFHNVVRPSFSLLPLCEEPCRLRYFSAGPRQSSRPSSPHPQRQRLEGLPLATGRSPGQDERRLRLRWIRGQGDARLEVRVRGRRSDFAAVREDRSGRKGAFVSPSSNAPRTQQLTRFLSLSFFLQFFTPVSFSCTPQLFERSRGKKQGFLLLSVVKKAVILPTSFR